MLSFEDYMELVQNSGEKLKEAALDDARNNDKITFYQFVKIFHAAYPEAQ